MTDHDTLDVIAELGNPAVTLTVDEISALRSISPNALPPDIGDDDIADVRAGVLSLVARGLLPESADDPHPLGLLFACFGAADHRLAVHSWSELGAVQASLHVGPELGVLHLGARDQLHAFHWVPSEAWPSVVIELGSSMIEVGEDWGTDDVLVDGASMESMDDIIAMCTITALVPADGEVVSESLSTVTTTRLWSLDDNSTLHPLSIGVVESTLERIAST